MNTATTNITAVLLGKLGEAVQSIFQQKPYKASFNKSPSRE
ncbi:hypothetical protein [Nibribacter ruber]|nr:hypothetical protein [Nibribacter ruber]